MNLSTSLPLPPGRAALPAAGIAPSSIDPTRLSAHCGQCATARGRLHRLHCAAEAVHGFLAPRFVTTLALALVLLLLSGALPT